MKTISALFAVILALAVTSVQACPDEKSGDDGKQSTPKPPTGSRTIG